MTAVRHARWVRLLVAAALLGCGGTSTRPGWVHTECTNATDENAGSIAYPSGTDLVLKRIDGSIHRVAIPACHEPRGVVVLDDGWRALVWSYPYQGLREGRLPGGEAACLVDFRAGTATTFDWTLLGEDLSRVQLSVGPSTGWLYTGGGRIIDVEHRRTADLSINVEGGEQVAIAEHGTSLRLIGTKYESIDPDHPIYRHHLLIDDYDTSVWPPTPGAHRDIIVKGRPDHRVVSPDGRWLAHSGQPYYVGMETKGPVSDVGLFDLEANTSIFEKQRGGIDTIEAVAVQRGRPWLLFRGTTGSPGDHAYALAWLDDHGTARGSVVVRAADTFTYDVSWLPAQRQVVVKEGCDYERISLPVPET